MAPMRIEIRSLTGESTEIYIEPTATINALKHAIQEKTQIPVAEQRLVFAGAQLEEAVNEAWRKRRAGGALSAALDVESIPDGAPLTLEHYAIQKGCVVNIVRRIATSATTSDANATGQPAADIPIAGSSEATRMHTPPRAGREDPELVAQLSRAVPENNSSTPPRARQTAPVVEFMQPEPLQNQAGPVVASAPSQGGGYRGNDVTPVNGRGNSVADNDIAKHLSGMSDTALYQLLAPILEQRPRLRASLQQIPAATGATAEDPSRVTPPRAPVMSASVAPSAAARSDVDRREPFRIGDLVTVWSNSAQRWCDGEVLRVARESSGKIPQGAVEVSFELGQKWIAPQDAPRILKQRNRV